ncbi:3-dehydro-L-gulonate 2-dehydrogenase [Candidatus Sumerlaeota bacterium]|nr:3-dehydro-L-gulonate 2-dehydrogenase [Candidatus Sumerlaeota bacterium]
MLRIPYDEMVGEFARVLLKNGFSRERAELSARLFADASRDGVYSHGANRFARHIEDIAGGRIVVDAEPELVETVGVVERWDGRQGPGNLNAWFCMNRAIEAARRSGIGCVAIRNTNHWLRPGNFGLQAADAGCIGICWSNTINNLPAWGAKEARLGNNPVVIAVPRDEGHVLLDMAMSQFSFGKLAVYARSGEPLPVVGGYDEEGRPTRDAAAIARSRRAMPIGYWKGAGLSMMLDLIAALLSGGNAIQQIAALGAECMLSQVFIAIDVDRIVGHENRNRVVHEILEYAAGSEPAGPDERVYFPGERTLLTRAENLAKGVPVDPEIWEGILRL